MKRLIDSHLIEWKDDKYRKPLLLRGARQVGKTYAVRNLGKKFSNFIEINFELHPQFRSMFEKDLDPNRIIQEISLNKKQEIKPGKTLLFFDEIQIVPDAIIALRYFYEMMPELHVIAAGSLLDFAVLKVGMPVGRVSSLYIYPMSFMEFLYALGYDLLADFIEKKVDEMGQINHNKLLELIGQYLAIGGMPEAVKRWRDTKNPLECFKVHQAIIDTYKTDFDKYANKYQIKYVNTLFNNIPKQLSKKFIYSNTTQDYRARELAPALELLETAGIINKVARSLEMEYHWELKLILKTLKFCLLMLH